MGIHMLYAVFQLHAAFNMKIRSFGGTCLFSLLKSCLHPKHLMTIGSSVVLNLFVEDVMQQLLIRAVKIVHFHLPLLMKHDDAFHLTQSANDLSHKMVVELLLTFWTSYFVVCFFFSSKGVLLLKVSDALWFDLLHVVNISSPCRTSILPYHLAATYWYTLLIWSQYSFSWTDFAVGLFWCLFCEWASGTQFPASTLKRNHPRQHLPVSFSLDGSTHIYTTHTSLPLTA